MMFCDACGKETKAGTNLTVSTWKLTGSDYSEKFDSLGLKTESRWEGKYLVAPQDVFICQDCCNKNQKFKNREKLGPALVYGVLGLAGLLIIIISTIRNGWGQGIGTYVCSGISVLLFIAGLVNLWPWLHSKIGSGSQESGPVNALHLSFDSLEVSNAVYRRVGETEFCSMAQWEEYQRTKKHPRLHRSQPYQN